MAPPTAQSSERRHDMLAMEALVTTMLLLMVLLLVGTMLIKPTSHELAMGAPHNRRLWPATSAVLVTWAWLYFWALAWWVYGPDRLRWLLFAVGNVSSGVANVVARSTW